MAKSVKETIRDKIFPVGYDNVLKRVYEAIISNTKSEYD